MENITPFEATHPGSLIKDEIAYRGISQKEFAHSIAMQPTMLNELIKGKRTVTAEIALALEKALQISAEYWMRFQAGYDLDCARINKKNITKIEHIEQWKVISEYINVAYLKKNNLINNTLSKSILTIKSIFKISNIDDLITQYAGFKQQFALYRKSEKLQIEEKNLFTWQMLAKYKASHKNINKYDATKINELLKKLNEIIFENNQLLNKVENNLNQYGIKFLVLEKLDKTPVDGVAFWSGDNPAIVVTLRKKNIDYFAFTILHELAHVILHLSTQNTILDIDKMDEKSIIEQEADVFAQKTLINPEIWDRIKHNLTSDTEIQNLANLHKIHPAILLGRKCWESQNYKIFTQIDKSIN